MILTTAVVVPAAAAAAVLPSSIMSLGFLDFVQIQIFVALRHAQSMTGRHAKDDDGKGETNSSIGGKTEDSNLAIIRTHS